jgi:hypothetical protein
VNPVWDISADESLASLERSKEPLTLGRRWFAATLSRREVGIHGLPQPYPVAFAAYVRTASRACAASRLVLLQLV